MGLKPRPSVTTAAQRAQRAKLAELEAAVSDLKAALAKEQQRARYLEIELSETTDKYQELTRKSMDFEENLADVQEERDEALSRVKTLEEERDDAQTQAKVLQRRVDALEKQEEWGLEGKKKLAAAHKQLVEMKAKLEMFQGRQPRPTPPRATTAIGSPAPRPPGPPTPAGGTSTASQLPLKAPFDDDEDTEIDAGPAGNRMDVGRESDD